MKITLRRLREAKGWSLKKASIAFNMDIKTIKAYENYKKVPEPADIIKMLKVMGFYFDEIYFIIYSDISLKYKG